MPLGPSGDWPSVRSPTEESENRIVNSAGTGSGHCKNHDPPILGLFRKLPGPEEDWPAKDRLKWLQTAANIFELVHKAEGGIILGLARAERSPQRMTNEMKEAAN
jgi:hypothetical protein